MFCSNCGVKLEDGETRCPYCGSEIDQKIPEEQPVQPADSAYEQDAYAEPEKPVVKQYKNSKYTAVAGLICMILSFLTCCIPFIQIPLAVVGLILSIIGLKSEYKTMATVSLILSIISLIFGILMIVFGAILIANADLSKEWLDYFNKMYPQYF